MKRRLRGTAQDKAAQLKLKKRQAARRKIEERLTNESLGL
tara:strand:- start:128 stop:247 length:120 start_codon:yes stop_codon:yes gene_type:complete